MDTYLHCLSRTPLVGFAGPEQAVLDEMNGVIADTRQQIATLDPELVVLSVSDHYNGFFYDVTPPPYLGVGTTAIGDLANAVGDLSVSAELAEVYIHVVINSGIDLAVSYNIQVDRGFTQQLEFLLGSLDRMPVLPVLINGVTAPLPGFQRARLLGEAIDCFLNTLNKRVLILGSGGLSYRPPVPELAKANAHLCDRLLDSGEQLPPDEHERRQQWAINTARRFTEDRRSLHLLSPIWDNRFMNLLEQGWLVELDAIDNDEPSTMVEKSMHEIKTWVAAPVTLSTFGCWRNGSRYCRPIPEWVAGFGSLGTTTET